MIWWTIKFALTFAIFDSIKTFNKAPFVVAPISFFQINSIGFNMIDLQSLIIKSATFSWLWWTKANLQTNFNHKISYKPEI